MATPTPLGATAGFPGFPLAQGQQQQLPPNLSMSLAQQQMGAYQQQQLNTM